MKRIILTMLAVLMVSAGWSRCLRVTLTDGTQVYYQLGGECNPMLRVGETGLTIDADSYGFEGIASFKILEEDAPVDLERVNDMLQSSTPAKIYDLNGVEVSGPLSEGIYVMKTEKATIKIVKR